MSDVKRWNVVNFDNYRTEPNGFWVKYQDHADDVKRREKAHAEEVDSFRQTIDQLQKRLKEAEAPKKETRYQGPAEPPHGL